MKKTSIAAIAAIAALILVLAAAAALVQHPSPSQSGTGKLTIMGTDPAVAASGVTDAQVSYSSVMAHQSGSDMASGWTQVSGSGTMDLMTSQSNAQALATSQVNAASYDAFRFNVDSCKVTYQGLTYAATVASTTLTAESQSAVHVNSSSSAAAVVDMRTFIQNTADTSRPQFVFSATAVATSVPPQTATTLTLSAGAIVDLSGEAWWNSFVAQSSTHLGVVASLSGNSMILNFHNTGSANAQVQEVIVTPVSASAFATATLPASFNGSAVFTVNGSGSVQQSTSLQASALLNGGASVNSGSSTNVTYNGSISFNAIIAGVHVTGILTGQEYMITVIGANTYASTTVVAS
jgi:Domain of unknown function (DUF4382)